MSTPPPAVRHRSRIGRPPKTAEQSSAMRAQVLTVARRLFAEEGFQAVSMRRIAADAGCAPMTLYGYFRSKNELLRHLWEDFFVELFERIALASRRGAPATRLRRACEAWLEYWLAHPDRYVMVYLNQDQAPAGEQYYVDSSAVLERHQQFRLLIEAAQAQGKAWPGDARRMAETLICGLQGIALACITIPEYPWPAPRQLLQDLLRIVLRP